MKRARAIALAAALALGAVAWARASQSPRAIKITMRNSHFIPATIRVAAGTTVRFELQNDDPIPHEFILGTGREQGAHERATRSVHDGLPGQASLGIGESDVVTYRFDHAGTIEFACHRPGHYTYGMRGTVVVTG